MAKIRVLTAARTLAIEAQAFISAAIDGSYNLILTRFNGDTLNLGNVRGPQGATGSTGATPSLRAISSTSQSISIAAKTFTLSGNNAAFPVGSIIRIFNTANVNNYMIGNVTAATTTSVTVNVTEIGGSGTFTAWTATLGAYSGAQGQPGQQGDQGPSGTDQNKGTTTARNSRFGVPGTLAARIALANQQPIWFNTTTNWWECYYELDTNTASGIKGLQAGFAPGWYPMGPMGPRATAYGNAGQNMTTGTIANTWTLAVAVAESFVRGSGIFSLQTSNQRLRTGQAGRYNFTGRSKFPNGSGDIAYAWVGDVPQGRATQKFSRGSAFSTEITTITDFLMPVNGEVWFENVSGDYAMGTGMMMTLEYIGPPLASD